VDNEHFATKADHARSQEDTLREQFDLPWRYFLYVGRLAREKNLARLLAAYSQYRQSASSKPWGLVVLGSGPSEDELKAMVVKQQIEGVHWIGFKQSDKLPTYYGLASCLILPSTSEPWGLVINEAMAAGVPILASDRCGAGAELVWPGVNGYLFLSHDIGSLSRVMQRISSTGVDLEAMRRAARESVACYTPQNWARALGDCIVVSMARRRLR
jgi:glycosyltransferase involved in cell wall biosynthesis